MKVLYAALAASLLATGSTATAQTANDAQCIILSNAFASKAKDENAKKVAEASIYFYLGRIGNSMTSAQLKALLEAQSKNLNQQNAGPTMEKCAEAVQSKVTMLQGLAPAKPAAAQTKPAPGR